MPPSNLPEPESTRRSPSPQPPGSPLRAVMLGVAVDVGGSALVGFVLATIYAVQLGGSGLSKADMREAMGHIPPTSAVAIAGTLLGALMSVLGGYVCARVVRRDEYRVGLVLAGIMALWGLTVESGASVDSMTLLYTACTAACNLLGVKFGAEQRQRAEAATP